MKFHEDILNGFKLESGHYFVTDGRPWQKKKSPHPEGGVNKHPNKVMCYACY